MDFYKYLRRELKVSIGVIEYLEKRYGDEPSDTVINRVMRLIEVLREIGLDIRYINQFNSLLDVIDIYDDEEFESRLNYIKKMNKKRSPYVNVNIIISIGNNVNSNTEEIDKIITLLEKEGLIDLLEDRTSSNAKILYAAKYETIRDNLNVLKEVKGYKTLIRNNIAILYKSTSKELKQIIDDIKEKEKNDNEVNNISNTTDTDNNKENEDKEKNNQEEINEEDNDNKENNSGMIQLGKEDNLTYMLNVLKNNMLPNAIILSCPAILKRKNLRQVSEIIDLLIKNNIPLSVLEFCPEILQRGKIDEISNIIHELKINGLSLDIIAVCPSILILSNQKKIDKIIDVLEQNKMSKYIIYSCPEVLISGNTKILIEVKNELSTSYPDINLVLDVSPYVFVEKVYNMSRFLDDDKTEYVNRKSLSNMQSITVIKNIDEVQKVINVLKEEKVDINVLKKDTSVLNKTSSKQVRDVIKEVNNQGFGGELIENKPSLIAFSSAMTIREVTNTLKQHKPKEYKQIIQDNPDIYIKSDKVKIENIFGIFEKNNLSEKIITDNSQILVREDEKEIEKVYKGLTKIGFEKQKIEKVPSLLIEGKSEYIEKNKKVFERNNIDMPLNILYARPTQNIEKNIDTVIENNLYSYIEAYPQILDIPNAQLQVYLMIARQKGIPLIIKEKNSSEKLNIEYFLLSKEKLSEKYNIKKEVIDSVQNSIEKQKTRKVKNDKLFNSVYPLLEKQIESSLESYRNDDVSYSRNSKVVSKQKVIRETYIDLEENVSNNGKQVLRKTDTSLMLNNTLEKLTKTNTTSSKKKQIEKILEK